MGKVYHFWLKLLVTLCFIVETNVFIKVFSLIPDTASTQWEVPLLVVSDAKDTPH